MLRTERPTGSLSGIGKALMARACRRIGAQSPRLNSSGNVLRVHRDPHLLRNSVELCAVSSKNSDASINTGHDDARQSFFVKTLALSDGFIAQDQDGGKPMRGSYD
jgi:hypothetical protein